ncbi:MAG: type I DNA topoisomerase [Dehalococcoidia bacterium]|nr:type I DNA topoisomerase [Dehalococcoidia bacterium]
MVRAGSLVVVESPAKARTIAPFLGSGYTVKASLGHVRDLPKSRLGVDVDHEFEPKYLVPKEKKSLVDDLKLAARNAKVIYLATDPDREGEAISWHLLQAGEMAGVPIRRVVFHEITPEAIREAFEHPRDIDMNLVNAQQARRVVDRLVGYSLSPVLWRKIRGGLSAGRVQSVALRMIVDREREILNFVPQEYWSIGADLTRVGAVAAGRKPGKADLFRAGLVNLTGKRGRLTIPDQKTADGLVADLKPAVYSVTSVNKKQTQRQPQPPFTTSTLQQEASRKLGFTAQRTMSVAQHLYEGLDIGDGSPVGIITYMRTDSVRVADVAITQARQYIQQKYGGDFVPRSPRQFTQRARGAQEAHEAIRPTAITREPERLRSHLTPEQFRLYDLIWKRMVASQMANATVETVTVDVDGTNAQTSHSYLLRAASSLVVFPGYQVLYSESKDEDDNEDEQAQAALAKLAAKDPLDLQGLDPKQHFTQPLGRYTDATLIKALEANGIGRPSTYAAILSTLQDRGYAHKEKRQFLPDELGFLVCDLLTEHFPQIVDIQFTAHMEDELDEIAEGKQEWVPVVKEFYAPFALTIERANELIPKVEFVPEPTGEPCEKCGRPMVFRLGRFGKFIACSGFPECRNTKPILNIMGVKCPKDGGEMVEKRGRARGRVFYGCANFPACDFTTWDKPLVEPCPECSGLLVQPRPGRTKCTKCAYTSGGATTGKAKPVVAKAVTKQPRQLAPAGRA